MKKGQCPPCNGGADRERLRGRGNGDTGVRGRAAPDAYPKDGPYAVEGIWQRITIEGMNAVLVNGEKVDRCGSAPESNRKTQGFAWKLRRLPEHV